MTFKVGDKIRDNRIFTVVRVEPDAPELLVSCLDGRFWKWAKNAVPADTDYAAAIAAKDAEIADAIRNQPPAP